MQRLKHAEKNPEDRTCAFFWTEGGFVIKFFTAKQDKNPIKIRRTGDFSERPTKGHSAQGIVPTRVDLFIKQVMAAYFHESTKQQKKGALELKENQQRLLVHTRKVQSCLANMISVTLKERVLHAETYSRDAIDADEWGKCETLRKKCFWPHTPNAVCLSPHDGFTWTRYL